METPQNPLTQPVQLQSPRSQSDSLSILLTAAIFFGLGFVIAYLLYGSNSASPSRNDIQAAVSATFTALTPPPPTAIPVALTLADHSPSLGPDSAPITIVEFSDFTCGYCGYFHRDTLNALLEHYGDNVRFVYRYFPRFEEAVPLSVAGQCSQEQGKFWEYSNLLWLNQISEEPADLTTATLASFAQQSGINIDQFNTCFNSENATNLIISDYQTGRSFGVNATPTYFINGEVFVGAQPIELFINFIDDQLRQQGLTPPTIG